MQLGLPEAQLPLAQAAVLLATAPKSNSAVVKRGIACIAAARFLRQHNTRGTMPVSYTHLDVYKRQQAMYTAPSLRSACSHSRLKLPMCGVEG